MTTDDWSPGAERFPFSFPLAVGKMERQWKNPFLVHFISTNKQTNRQLSCLPSSTSPGAPCRSSLPPLVRLIFNQLTIFEIGPQPYGYIFPRPLACVVVKKKLETRWGGIGKISSILNIYSKPIALAIGMGWRSLSVCDKGERLCAFVVPSCPVLAQRRTDTLLFVSRATGPVEHKNSTQ